MIRIRSLLLTLLLASCALPGHARQSPVECTKRGIDADRATSGPACTAATSATPADATARRDTLGLDCALYVLGGLASGAPSTGAQAGQLASATIRHCSLRGYIFGVAALRPPPARDPVAG